MTTVLDIQALQAAAGIRIPLVENVRVRSGSVTSDAVQGFSDVRAVELVVRVPVLRGHPAPSVTVTVEKSTNGSDWTTGHAFTFTATGEDSFTLDAPDDYLRVVCVPAGGLREAVVSVVASIVTVDAPAGESEGGGSAPTTREELSSNGVVIAPGDFEWVTWDISDGPNVVLDRSVVAHPTVIVAGVYCVSVTIRCSPGNADGTFNAGLYLDRSGFNASQIEFQQSGGNAIDTTIAVAWYIPAGGKVEVGVDYTSGSVADAHAYILSAHIQRLS